MQERCNKLLDRLVRPFIRLGGHSVASFQLCGYCGLALAISLTMGLVYAAGLAVWVMAAITLAAIGTFLGLALLSRLLLDEEQLVYYHHEIAILLVSGLLTMALGQPVLPYLDLTMLGIGAFLICGRIGCLMAGCCHGQPHHCGVLYRPDHVAIGFPAGLVGARLFPTQLVESLWVAVVVIAGSLLVLKGAAPGSALAWYIVAYDCERFTMEFMRGDRDRAYYGGFSEAQWISLGLLLAVSSAELAGLLPLHWWHLAVTSVMAGAMALIAMQRRGRLHHRLLQPAHIEELATMLNRLAPAQAEVDPLQLELQVSSLGIAVSHSRLALPHRLTDCYTISRPAGGLSEETANTVGRLIANLRHPDAQPALIRGAGPIYHLLINPQEVYQ